MPYIGAALTDASVVALSAVLDQRLSKQGGAVSGPITLPGDPTSDLQATTKAYVDALIEEVESLALAGI